MRDLPKNIFGLPPEQQAIRAKCFHPTGTFIEFKKEEIEQSIPDRFERIVRLYPDRLAVKTKGQQLTYEELNYAANRVARAILAQRGPRQEPIALLFDHDARIIPAVLGVLKAGKIYVPLDPSYPEARAAGILEDSQAELMLTDNKNYFIGQELARHVRHIINVDELDPHLSTENLSLSIPPDTLAFIVYTSGSTGQPKGVIQDHRNALHNAMRVANGLHICSADRTTLFGSFTTG